MVFALHGALAELHPTWPVWLALLLVAFALGFSGAPFWAFTALFAFALIGFGAPWGVTLAVLAVCALFLIPPLRRVLSLGIMKLMKKLDFLPAISPTEQEAIAAGNVWVEGELFSGKPDFERLRSQPYADLSAEERAFVEGPVEQVCRMTDDWEVWQRRDLPPEVWEFLKRERFFGLIIPKEYGGLGFSPSANSAVVKKCAAASSTLGITVMVPNSLGPAELLIHYGTEAQKNHYLPRLARGEEIPAFALTEPEAGSDASAMTSHGVVFRGDDGELYLRLSWRKRYITLAAISSVLGLAFKLRDPEELLGRGKDLGITCALVPTSTRGVVLGKRHDPLGVPFWNSPTEGHDVVVKLEDAVIGGTSGVGKGWRMLMQSLAAGRGVSLPASSTGGAKAVSRVVSAHALVRKQFGLSIGKFEGIEEPLARIGALTYLMEAARRYTNGGLDAGEKPAVVTAMMKHTTTELFRKIVNDGMDVLGGNAISRGPRNVLASAYATVPISITVEGANILTRTLIVFGQGAIRCHPHALREMTAMLAWDVKAFDQAFFGHIGHVVRNACRSVGLSLTRGLLATVPRGETSAHYRKLAWSSASFAFLADLAMATLGADLKRREKLAGRFADIFAWMYLASATLTRFEAEGGKKEDAPFFHYAMHYAFARMQEGFDGIFENLRVPGLTWLFRGPIAAFSRMNRLSPAPSDRLGHRVAAAMLRPGAQRERLFGDIFVPQERTRAVGRLEHAFRLAFEAEGVTTKLRKAVREKRVPKAALPVQIEAALSAGVLTAEEVQVLARAEEARRDAIEVDSFTIDQYFATAERSEDGERAGWLLEQSGQLSLPGASRKAS